MEKIQSAIAMARAARAGQSTPGTADTVADPQTAGPQTADPQTAGPQARPVAAPDAVAAAWAALPTFKPQAARLARSHIVAFEGGREATAFDVLRTKLVQQMRSQNWRRLAITSPGAACGKSTITLNLGFSLARQTDQRTLIVDLDMRRPSLASTLGITAPNSFARVLEGRDRFEDDVLRYGANLAFATNHGPVRNPAELLGGQAVPQILADIEARYAPDVVIFDMPPLLFNDDAMAFMGQVDCVLLIAAAEASTIKEIDICERQLASQTNVLGVVLNKCRYMGPDYGY